MINLLVGIIIGIATSIIGRKVYFQILEIRDAKKIYKDYKYYKEERRKEDIKRKEFNQKYNKEI